MTYNHLSLSQGYFLFLSVVVVIFLFFLFLLFNQFFKKYFSYLHKRFSACFTTARKIFPPILGIVRLPHYEFHNVNQFYF